MKTSSATVGYLHRAYKPCFRVCMQLLLAVAGVLSSTPVSAQLPDTTRVPDRLIDMHVHAWESPPQHEPFRRSLRNAFSKFHLECAVVSGPAPAAVAAAGIAPGVLLAGAAHGAGSVLPRLADFAILLRRHQIAVLGELDNPWDGVPFTDERLEPFLRVSEEAEVPVGVFTGVAPSGTAKRFPKYRVELGRPTAVEPVLSRHPRLRLYLMQAGWPFLDETIAVMHAYAGVYADIGNIAANPAIPRDEFYHYLRALIRAGLGNRLMFGSGLELSQWSDGIGSVVESIVAAPFLSPSDRANIFHANAERFLKLQGR